MRTDHRLTSGATSSGAGIANSHALAIAKERIIRGDRLPSPASRVLSADERMNFVAELRQMRAALTTRLILRGRRHNDITAGVLQILKDTSTFRSRTHFDDPAAMRAATGSLHSSVAAGRKIVLALPLGGSKAANPVKTGWHHLPDASEWAAWSILGAIANAIAALHAPGALVVLLPDAPLHTGDLSFAAPETSAHLRQAQVDLAELGLSPAVRIPDVLAALPDTWHDEVHLRARDARERHETDPAFASQVAEQVKSLLFSVNLRAGAPSMEEAVLLNAALAGDRSGIDLALVERADAIMDHVQRVVPHYVGVNHALRTLDLPGRLTEALTGSPVHLRLTVHAKAGEPQPNLVPAGSRARPGLLPLHGVGLRYLENQVRRIATAFELEALMEEGAMSVVDATGRFLFHEVQ